MSRVRTWSVTAVVVLATALPLGYVVAARQDAGSSRPVAAARDDTAQPALPARPRLLFRSTADDSYGSLAAVPAADPAGAPVVLPHHCSRLDARAGRTVCAAVDTGFLDTVHAYVLDEELRVVHDLPVKGVPSRVRLSPDGARVAVTVFVTGHSYTASGFSTSTTIWDTGTGQQLGELERFRFTHQGTTVDAADRNFWGVTFARDGSTFYATMATGGRTHLVRGDVRTRTGETVADAVECPALSPDETRIAFKQRRPGDVVRWTLAVLDLRTLERTVLPVEGDVDDQPYWLDDATVAYARPRGDTGQDASREDTWTVPADGSRPARLLRRDASSLVRDG